MQVKCKSLTALMLSLVLAFATLIGGVGLEPEQVYAEEMVLPDGAAFMVVGGGNLLPGQASRLLLNGVSDKTLANYIVENAIVSSSNRQVVDDDGIVLWEQILGAGRIGYLITPSSVGTTTITLQLGDQSVSYDLTVSVDSVFIPKGGAAPHYTLQPEENLTIPCFTPEGVSPEDLTWTSSDEEVAVVDQNGKVTELIH